MAAVAVFLERGHLNAPHKSSLSQGSLLKAFPKFRITISMQELLQEKFFFCLEFRGGSVAPILWGHFQAIKSFICVDLKESCEVPLGWNPLQRVTTVSMGVTITGSHQYCPHVLMKRHQRHNCGSSESSLKGALQAEGGKDEKERRVMQAERQAQGVG
ncbi:hypothetical protein JOB18_029899 [Solea senegalensis]|uniref:Uncharacterized protein n=1 Tax=Solea senegalensis TaxID=28829 RepID=A0AAV6Q5A7_SOLSE|nr:hypothetical protein JOB18_029899 [Solea senegalensis]